MIDEPYRPVDKKSDPQGRSLFYNEGLFQLINSTAHQRHIIAQRRCGKDEPCSF